MLFFSCAGRKIADFKDIEKVAENTDIIPDTISFCFAGDIMAHRENFSMKNYSIIWDDIRETVSSADFSFANIETVIDDNEAPQTYPNFSVHSDYIEEVVKAGFNVFSLANNHINDQGWKGINSTIKWSEKISLQTDSSRKLYFSGLHYLGNDFSYCLIEKEGWKIIFIAATELLNQYNSLSYINYTEPTQKGRQRFIERLKKIKSENDCDLFILSLHTAETEYVLETSSKQNQFYMDLLNNAGVDIVWANHVHVARPWSVVVNKRETDKREADKLGVDKREADKREVDKLLMRANGNTISGQRRAPHFKTPEEIMEYTGDGLLLYVTFEKKVYNGGNSIEDCIAANTGKTENRTGGKPTDDNSGEKKFELKPEKKIKLKSIEPIFITTYITPEWNFVIKKLDDNFIQSLEIQNRKTWAAYLKERKKLMEKIKGNTICQ